MCLGLALQLVCRRDINKKDCQTVFGELGRLGWRDVMLGKKRRARTASPKKALFLVAFSNCITTSASSCRFLPGHGAHHSHSHRSRSRILVPLSGHPGLALRDRHRYLESGLHPGRTVHGLPALSRRERSRPTLVHYGSRGPAALGRPRSGLETKALLR